MYVHTHAVRTRMYIYLYSILSYCYDCFVTIVICHWLLVTDSLRSANYTSLNRMYISSFKEGMREACVRSKSVALWVNSFLLEINFNWQSSLKIHFLFVVMKYTYKQALCTDNFRQCLQKSNLILEITYFK